MQAGEKQFPVVVAAILLLYLPCWERPLPLISPILTGFSLSQLEGFAAFQWKTSSPSIRANSKQPGKKQSVKQWRRADWILYDSQEEQQQQVPTAAVTTVKNLIPPASPAQTGGLKSERLCWLPAAPSPALPLDPTIQEPFRGWPSIKPDLCPRCHLSDYNSL